MTVAAIRRRIASITTAIRPPDSLEARLQRLTAEQRATFRYWQDRCDQWHRDNPDGAAYAAMLDGDPGPHLRSDVREALFGPTVQITADMTDAQIEQMYRKLAFNGD